MKQFILIIITVLSCTQAIGQLNQPLLDSYHFNLNSSRYNPSHLGLDNKKFHLNIFNVYAYGTTNFADAEVITDAISDDGKTLNISNLSLDKLKDKNLLALGLIAEVFNIGVTFGNKKKDDLFSLKLGVASRSDFTGNFRRDLLSLATEGNSQFAGQTLDIAPTINGFSALEVNLGGALNLDFIDSDILNLRAGINFKYLLPTAGVYTENAKADFFTAADGSEVEIDYDLLINAATANEDELFVGNGFGVDVGIHAEVLDHFFGGISVLDIGTINFESDSSIAYQSDDKVTYDGVEFNLDEGADTGIEIDSLFQLNEIRGNSFSIPLPTKIIFTAGFRTNKKTKKDKTYYPHTFKVTYVQGFDENSGATSNPFLSGSYVHSIKNILNLGTNIGLGGANAFQSGAFFSVKGGPFRFGVGSSNAITAIVAQDKAKGLDLQSTMTFAF